jgi:hypothetical protein
MSSLTAGLFVFACIFGASFVATRIRPLLPEPHQSAETKDTVKLAMALVATMTALVLGLLVGSAKGTYDAEKANVATTSAKIVMLDRVLAHYGTEAMPVRMMLRTGVQHLITGLWPSDEGVAQLDPSAASGDLFYDALQQLTPKDDVQRAMKAQALSGAYELGQIRWLLYEQSTTSISVPLLVGVVLWLMVLFFSFGLFAPPNSTAFLALLVSAMSVSGAIFLILELDQPFNGLIHISSEPMIRAHSHLGK